MKVLVTGANGYIGAHVIQYLLGHTNYQVTAVDFSNTFIDEHASFIQRNILSDAEDPQLYKDMGEPDIIIHMAWRNGFEHKAESHLTDLPRHYFFLKNMIDAGVQSVSVMGTMHEVGYYEGAITEKTPCWPLSLYGISKNALRQSIFTYATNKNVSIKWLRGYYILGDNARSKSIFSKILEWSKEGKKTFPFTMGTNKYDFISVQELSKQIVESSIQNNIDGIINVCSGKPISLKDVVENFIAEKQLNIKPDYGAFPDRKYDSPAVWGDNSVIQNILKASNMLRNN